MMNEIRSEKEIFEDLEALCCSDGYVHVIAYFCFKDNTILASENGQMISSNENPSNRLIRTEIATLIGLMVKKEIKLPIPPPDIFDTYINQTQALLHELHQTMYPSIGQSTEEVSLKKRMDLFTMGTFLKEGIFYAGESAFPFQYRDLSLKKYEKDDSWFIEKKGFSFADAILVITAVINFQNEKLTQTLSELKDKDVNDWSVLDGYIFSANDITQESNLTPEVVSNVLDSFCLPQEGSNDSFNELGDFNLTNAYPLIFLNDSNYLLLQHYTLLEALYETPFFWLKDDEAYKDEAATNRGAFVENAAVEWLSRVFGKHNVFKNVEIKASKKEKSGEIDVLVLYADRAIILQAKSKKLTLAARKGNDNLLKDDFKKAIQDAYDQGFSCAELLNNKQHKFYINGTDEIEVPDNLKKIYIFCTISEHYPSLSYQSKLFLNFKETEQIAAPFVMDLFLLDVMAEMLNSPLYFLSYVDRRCKNLEKFGASHELLILDHHLKRNLWLDGDNTFMYVADHDCLELYEALLTRRENYPGKETPEGILTRFKNTSFEKLIKQITHLEHPEAVNLGLILLTCSGEFINGFNSDINRLLKLVKTDGNGHDITILLYNNCGLTIHINFDSEFIAQKVLKSHCERRKYIAKATDWYGLCLNPVNLDIRLALSLSYDWKYSEEMEKTVKPLIANQEKVAKSGKKKKRKIGRNEFCPCESGKKYKKCCINKKYL